ncbi:hypothetical protein GGX14DRAFT_611339 [Mycena pura]|uniref:Uncharacterized protein n=1 Tax=Mycena pura TaxID=153505 RepID=A0AAD6Y2S5_9AGAR|nr:hypothetical protein GGX14DRAFT_611339 [Mycena pura]
MSTMGVRYVSGYANVPILTLDLSSITTTAFSAVIAISEIVIFFAVQWSNINIDWTGNDLPFLGCDGEGCPLLPIPDSGTFGPVVGEFHVWTGM